MNWFKSPAIINSHSCTVQDVWNNQVGSENIFTGGSKVGTVFAMVLESHSTPLKDLFNVSDDRLWLFQQHNFLINVINHSLINYQLGLAKTFPNSRNESVKKFLVMRCNKTNYSEKSKIFSRSGREGLLLLHSVEGCSLILWHKQ